MLKILENELSRLENAEKEIEKTLKNTPKGKLRCSTSRGCFQYYQGKTYLNKDKREFVEQLAQKEYCNSIKSTIRKLKNNLELVIKVYKEEELEQIYRKMCPARKAVVNPLFKPIEEIISEFNKIEYIGKEFNDKSEYYTSKGERVRSKSEKIIADELCRYGVPYKYEMPIELTSWNKVVIIYSDFTALNKKTGKKWIIEHLGIMDNPEYYNKAMLKLETYEKNNIMLGDGLLIFHETATIPLNIKVVQRYIEKYLI